MLMLNPSKLLCASALLLVSVISCSEKPTVTKVTTKSENLETTQEAANNVATPPPPASTPVPAKKKEPDYVRIGRFDPSGKYSLAMKRDSSDVVIADQRGMITPIPFDSSSYVDVSFSDPSSTGLIIIVANKSESADGDLLGPVDFDLIAFTLGADKTNKLPVKLPGKHLLGWALADNQIVLASGGQKKGKFDLKITVIDQTGKQLAEYSPTAPQAAAYEVATNTKGDVFGLIQFNDNKKAAQSFYYKSGKAVPKLYVPKELAALPISLDSMDADGNVIASIPGGDSLDVYKFNPLKADGKAEKLSSRPAVSMTK